MGSEMCIRDRAMSIVGSKMISSASKRRLPASKKGSMFSPRDAEIFYRLGSIT